MDMLFIHPRGNTSLVFNNKFDLIRYTVNKYLKNINGTFLNKCYELNNHDFLASDANVVT